MNWYKWAQIELEFVSYFDGPFKVGINGKLYTFYIYDKDFAMNLKWQIENQPFRHGKILNLLKKRYSDPELHKELNPQPEAVVEPIKKTQPTFWD